MTTAIGNDIHKIHLDEAFLEYTAEIFLSATGQLTDVQKLLSRRLLNLPRRTVRKEES